MGEIERLRLTCNVCNNTGELDVRAKLTQNGRYKRPDDKKYKPISLEEAKKRANDNNISGQAWINARIAKIDAAKRQTKATKGKRRRAAEILRDYRRVHGYKDSPVMLRLLQE